MARASRDGEWAGEWREIATLRPHPRNARTHSPEQIRQIAASIRRFGFNRLVVINGRGVILAGHGSVDGAKAAGLMRVPVRVLDGLTDAEERAYMLADNRISLNSAWDGGMLKAELADLSGLGMDLPEIGFSLAEIPPLDGAPIAPLEAPADDDDERGDPGGNDGVEDDDEAEEAAEPVATSDPAPKPQGKNAYPVIFTLDRPAYKRWLSVRKALGMSENEPALEALMNMVEPGDE